MGSSHHNALKELVALTWCALKQSHGNGGEIDEETFQFFSTPTSAKAPPKERAQSPLAPLASAPVYFKQEVPVTAPPKEPAQPLPEAHQSFSSPQEPEAPPMDTEDNPSVAKRRLEKLLPRPFASTPADTTSTRKSISSSASMPHLSSVSLYQEAPSKPGAKRWAIFTYLPPATPPTPKEVFLNSVVTAIEKLLPVQATTCSCYDPSFALHLLIAVDDCDVVLFFVDSHLHSALSSLLESIPAFSHSSQPIESPFVVLGTLHGRTLRAVILHTSTHTDTSIKGALWQSLKALATLTPPQ